MRIANLTGRAVLLADARALDVERASGGRFGADPQSVWNDWAAFRAWAASIDPAAHPNSAGFNPADLGAPVPRPSQVFGVGPNYADHAAESKMELPEHPLVFTKFPSSLTGHAAEVRLSGDRVDWEAELVVVIGSGGRNIPESNGWDAVAGLTGDKTSRTGPCRAGASRPSSIWVSRSLDMRPPARRWLRSTKCERRRISMLLASSAGLQTPRTVRSARCRMATAAT